ncbi:MAG: PHP-associated domain-containing protein [Candidatus Kariarchaeaceae archaeon]
MIIDIHNHAELSINTSLTFTDYLTEGQTKSLSFAITEHNRLSKKSGIFGEITVFSGMEILNDYGHYLVFGAPQDAIARREIFDLIDYVHESGGAIIVAHPYKCPGLCKIKDDELVGQIIDKVDGVETLNGRGNEVYWSLAEKLAIKHNKPQFGGSNAHSFKDLFKTATVFERTITGLSELIKEIKNGRCKPIILENQQKFNIGLIK